MNKNSTRTVLEFATLHKTKNKLIWTITAQHLQFELNNEYCASWVIDKFLFTIDKVYCMGCSYTLIIALPWSVMFNMIWYKCARFLLLVKIKLLILIIKSFLSQTLGSIFMFSWEIKRTALQKILIKTIHCFCLWKLEANHWRVTNKFLSNNYISRLMNIYSFIEITCTHCNHLSQMFVIKN